MEGRSRGTPFSEFYNASILIILGGQNAYIDIDLMMFEDIMIENIIRIEIRI